MLHSTISDSVEFSEASAYRVECTDRSSRFNGLLLGQRAQFTDKIKLYIAKIIIWIETPNVLDVSLNSFSFISNTSVTKQEK